MKKLFKIFAILAVVFLYNCEQDDSPHLSNYVGFEIGPINYELEKDATTTAEVIVATSEKSGSDRSYTILVDTESSTLAAPYTVPGTVTIPANSNTGTLSIPVTDNDDLGFVPQTLVLDFQDEEGMSFGNPITLNFVEQCLDNKVNLAIQLDNWPEETAWELYDLSGTPTVIDFRDYGTFADAEHYSTVSFDFCLPAGNYGVVVYDSYGDGIINEAGTAYRSFTVSMGGEVLATAAVSSATNSVTFTLD